MHAAILKFTQRIAKNRHGRIWALGVCWAMFGILGLPSRVVADEPAALLFEQEQQPLTIVCLGDSVTGIYYYHTGGQRAYPELLEIALRRLYP